MSKEYGIYLVQWNYYSGIEKKKRKKKLLVHIKTLNASLEAPRPYAKWNRTNMDTYLWYPPFVWNSQKRQACGDRKETGGGIEQREGEGQRTCHQQTPGILERYYTCSQMRFPTMVEQHNQFAIIYH